MSSLGSTLVFIQQQIIRYVFSTYLVFGMIGCSLNIILLSRRQFRTVSCCIYFIMSSITMLIILPLAIVPYIYALYHENPTTTIVAFCKARYYILQSTTMMYRWWLAAACIDRCMLTSTNQRSRNLASVRIAYRVVIINIIIWLILTMQVLFLYNLRDGRCGILYDVAISLYFSCYTLITGGILPVSIMFICAIFIHRNLKIKRQLRRQLRSNDQNEEGHSERRRDQQVFAMLLLQTIVYLVTQTPWMLLNFNNAATIYITNKSADRLAIEQFLTFMAETALMFFAMISFYLYTMASQKFRHELWKLLSYLLRYRCRNNINQTHPTTNDTSPVRETIV